MKRSHTGAVAKTSARHAISRNHKKKQQKKKADADKKAATHPSQKIEILT